MANVTKQDLIGEISKNTGLTQADVKVAVEEFLSVISDTLVGRKSIEIRGFGTFLTKIRKPRPARNPKTGEVVPLLQRTVPLFKFSSELKAVIDASASGKPVKAEGPAAKPKGDAEIY